MVAIKAADEFKDKTTAIEAIHSCMRAAESATKCREAADFDNLHSRPAPEHRPLAIGPRAETCASTR